MNEANRDNEKKQQDCCGLKPEQPVPVQNQCKKECCRPIEVQCDAGDIRTAKCIPILSQRIYDCICLENEQMRYLEGLQFTIKSDKDYEEGAEICVEEILVKYDCVGLINDKVPVIVDNLEAVNFYPSSESPICECNICGTPTPIYTIYKGSVVTDINGCQEGRKTKIVEPNLKFYVCGLQIKVIGKIGCKPFRAETGIFNGELASLTPSGNGFKDVDFFGRICLPIGKHRIRFEEMFEGCISADCVTPTQIYEGDCRFTADILATLLVNKTIYATVKEELVVFTTPNGIVCNRDSISSSCQSSCEPGWSCE